MKTLHVARPETRRLILELPLDVWEAFAATARRRQLTLQELGEKLITSALDCNAIGVLLEDEDAR